MLSNLYKNISKINDWYYLIYIIFAVTLVLKDMNTILALLIIFLPIQLKNLMISIYEHRANAKLFKQEQIDREKAQLTLQANLYFSGIVSITIIIYLLKFNEFLLSFFFILIFLFPLIYSLIMSKRDTKDLIMAYTSFKKSRKEVSRIKLKGQIKLK